MLSSTDILSISTGRETILIGPRSAFGAQASQRLIRDRQTILQTLQTFLGRPNAEELLRPYLRRWGVDPVLIRGANRAGLLQALARAAASGGVAIATVPDITLSFAGASLDDAVKQASPKPVKPGELPPI